MTEHDYIHKANFLAQAGCMLILLPLCAGSSFTNIHTYKSTPGGILKLFCARNSVMFRKADETECSVRVFCALM